MEILKFIVRVTLLLLVPVVVAAGTFLYMREVFFLPVDPSNTTKVLVEVNADTSFLDLGRTLVSKGLVKHSRALDVLQRFSNKAKGKAIKEGEYELSASMTPMQILEKFLSGEVLLREIEVPPGSSVRDVAKLLEAQGITSEKEFNEGLTNPDWLRQAGVRADSFEGYFGPGRYSFSRVDGVRHIIWTMMERAEKEWPAEYTKRADELEMSRHEVLTMASILQKEAATADDMYQLSSVYHNRINMGMKLEADSTAMYGLKDFNGTLTQEDLQNQHLYNTHFYYGLPPGPICNPGMEALKAAVSPPKTSLLFYVRDGAGKLIFSATHREYEDSLKKYKEFNRLAKAAGAGD